MYPGQPAGAGIARDLAALALGPDETPGLDRECAAQQREAQILPDAAALTLEQRGRDAVGEERRGEIIEDRAQHHLRLVGPAALKNRHPAEALQDLVEAALLAQRSAVAVAGQPAIDQPRVDRLEPRVVDAEPGRHRWPEILDQNVGGLDHPVEDCQPFRLLQIERERALAAVGAEKEAALACKARRKLAQHVALR